MRLIEGGPPDRKQYGNKSWSLWWLTENGFPVPAGVLVEKDWPFDNDELRRWILDALGELSTERRLIVRSSSLAEDSELESGAGLFLSVAGVDSWSLLESTLARVRSVGSSDKGGFAEQRIAAIIQRQVTAVFGGVVFPTDPISGNKEISVVEIAEGFAGPLLDGSLRGQSFLMSGGVPRILGGEGSISAEIASILIRVCGLGKSIEHAFGQPCDIEWAIDSEGKLWALQVRPVVRGRYENVGFWLVDEQFAILGGEAKVKLRAIAKEMGLGISRAWIMRANTDERLEALEAALSQLPENILCSFVVIEPSLVDGKVLRQFGYSSDAVELAAGLLKAVNLKFWKCTLIIKEVYDAEYTGVAVGDESGYWLEIAQGHYVPKGIVETSVFRFTRSGEIVYKRSATQTTTYRPSPGGAQIVQTAHKTEISEEQLRIVIGVLSPLFDRLEGAVEFGIGRSGAVFLLDYVAVTGRGRLDEDLAKSGIVSRGRAVGKLIEADNSLMESLATDWHARNEIDSGLGEEDAVIVASRRPYISLMLFLRNRSAQKIGFVFEEPAFLCHFAVQLRERGIAAIYCDRETTSRYVGRKIELDAETPGLMAEERIALRED